MISLAKTRLHHRLHALIMRMTRKLPLTGAPWFFEFRTGTHVMDLNDEVISIEHELLRFLSSEPKETRMMNLNDKATPVEQKLFGSLIWKL